MNIENMEQEFPKMPQSMRDMIEKEVEKQALKNKKLCPSCNRAIAKDHAYCPHCGASVQ